MRHSLSASPGENRAPNRHPRGPAPTPDAPPSDSQPEGGVACDFSSRGQGAPRKRAFGLRGAPPPPGWGRQTSATPSTDSFQVLSIRKMPRTDNLIFWLHKNGKLNFCLLQNEDISVNFHPLSVPQLVFRGWNFDSGPASREKATSGVSRHNERPNWANEICSEMKIRRGLVSLSRRFSLVSKARGASRFILGGAPVHSPLFDL